MANLDQELRVMGSDLDKTYRQNINVRIHISDLEKEWSTFLRNIPDNERRQNLPDSVTFRWKMANLEKEIKAIGSDWAETYRHNINEHNQISDLKKDWSTFLKNLPDKEDVKIFLVHYPLPLILDPNLQFFIKMFLNQEYLDVLIVRKVLEECWPNLFSNHLSGYVH